MATVGRNDPCPCGSGKKYKKCHQEQDEQRGRELRNLTGIDEWMAFHLRRIHEALTPRVEQTPAVIAAAEAYFAGTERPAHPLDDQLFRDHAFYDVPVDAEGETLATTLTLDDDLPSAADTKVMRQALATSYLSFVEVTDVKRGKGFAIKDALTGTEAFIWDETLSNVLDPMEVLLARRLPFAERPLLVPSWTRVWFHGRKKAIAAARAEFEAAALAEDDAAGRLKWLKAAAPRFVALARQFGRPTP
jgi:hypothetical protein